MRSAAQATAARVSQFVRTPRARRIGWWILGVVIAFGIIGFFIAPPVAKPYLVEALSRELEREVAIESLRINPFTLSVTVRGFVMKDRPGPEPALTFDELYINASLASLFRMAPVLDAVRLTKPHLRLVRTADGRHSFQDLVDESASKPKDPAAPPLRFAVANIEVADGRVDVDDRLESAQHALADIQLGIPFVSNLPVYQNINVEPKFAARLNDTAIEAQAKAKPFKDSRDSTVSLEIQGLDLVRFLEYVPGELPVKVRSAKLDTEIDITFAQPENRPPSITLAGTAGLRDIEVTEPGGEPLLKLPRLTAELHAIEPLANRYHVEKVLIESPEVRLHRPKGEEVYLLRLFKAQQGGAAKPAERPVTFSVGEIALAGGKLEWVDDRAARPVRKTFDEVRAVIRNLSSTKDAVGEFEAFLHDTRDEAASAAGRFWLEPAKAEGTLKLERLLLAEASSYVEPFVALQALDGKLDVATSLLYEDHPDAPNLTLSGLEATLRSLVLRQQRDKEELARLAELTVKGAGFDLRKQTVMIGELASSNARFSVKREQDGRFNLEKLLPERPGTEPRSAPAGGEKPWSLALKKLAVTQYALLVEDERAGPAATARIENLAVTGENLSNAKGERGNVDVRFRVNKTGSFAAGGQLGVNPVSTRLRVDARSVGILPLQPYFEQYVNAVVSSGDVTVKGAVALDLPDGAKPTGSFRGDFTLAEFAAVTRTATEDLLRWKSLHLGGIDTIVEPLKVDVKEVALSDFYARLIVNADGTLNLQGLVRSPEGAPGEATASPADASAEKAKPERPRAAAGAPLPISIGRITLQGGNVNFSDFFIKPNYSANLTGVGGTVTEITSQKAGDVELRARIDETAPVEIAGRLNPLAPELFLDLKATAKDIELPPLSPYAVKYAGYGIERGKLSVNVKYLIENGKLAADNNIYLDQLTFGEKVESPTATKLPVPFVVSLLKDRNGVIDLNLPISGTIEDPQFSIWAVIVQVIGNLITKAATAPFALLAGGGGGEELAYVEFAPGTATLDPDDEKKLQTLAKALGDRPGLKLDVAGRVDPATDREGLKRAAVDREVKAAKLKEITKGGKATGALDEVKVEPAEYTKYLTAAYQEAKFPKPRNVIGLAKELPVAEMEQLMLTNATATEEDLRVLANRRAQTTKDWLVGKGGIPAERVFLIAPKLAPEGIKDKGKPERVDFSLK